MTTKPSPKRPPIEPAPIVAPMTKRRHRERTERRYVEELATAVQASLDRRSS